MMMMMTGVVVMVIDDGDIFEFVCLAVLTQIKNAACTISEAVKSTDIDIIQELEIRSVERGICPIATSTTVPIAGCMAHARNDCISTSDLKSDVTIMFLYPDFLYDAKMSAIQP